MTERGKKYKEAVKLLDKDKSYLPQEAVELLKKTAQSKFDETVELHLRMGVDPRNATQQVRGVALLPHGLGKRIRILVFAQGEAERIAQAAGADTVGGDDLVKKVEGGWLEFDTAISTPEMMGKVGKLGKVLGRKGLMPNPKSGTVTTDIAKAVNELKAGKIEYRMDKQSGVKGPVGKLSFDEAALVENAGSFIKAVMESNPKLQKIQNVKSIALSSTMGPGLKLDKNQFRQG